MPLFEDIKVFSGNAHPILTKNICSYLDIHPAKSEVFKFSNDETFVDVPLIKIAYGRSGDKGNKSNIGIIARDEKFYPVICNFLTEEIVKKNFQKFLLGPVEKFYLPVSFAVNFLLHDVLGGGGPASLRNDPQGKAYAQILLDQMIPVPKKLLES